MAGVGCEITRMGFSWEGVHVGFVIKRKWEKSRMWAEWISCVNLDRSKE